jgi:flagella basal body P-ring formation protein FlgA
MFVLAASVEAWSSSSTCIPVDGEYILARHVVPRYQEFQTLDGDLTLSYAPIPGGRRTVSAAEISNWAASHSLKVSARESACFERTGIVLTADDYRNAIRGDLAADTGQVKIEILDFYSRVLPPGRLELPVAGAALPPDEHPETAFLWRGTLVSSSGPSYPVWARVRVTAMRSVVRVIRSLPSGAVLDPGDIRAAVEQCNPFRLPDSEAPTFYVGKSLVRSVRGGSALEIRMVQEPPVVRRGDKVRVAVLSGSARIEMEARADVPGNVGDSISFTNPSGAKRFNAVITGPGRAEIVVDGLAGNRSRRTTVQTFEPKGNS